VIKEVLSQFPFALMPTLVMLLFLLFFVSMVIWVYRRGSSELYKEIEQIPLGEESQQ
jgi:cbb3-type cytochrome oxidase subunit 3